MEKSLWFFINPKGLSKSLKNFFQNLSCVFSGSLGCSHSIYKALPEIFFVTVQPSASLLQNLPSLRRLTLLLKKQAKNVKIIHAKTGLSYHPTIKRTCPS